MAGSPAVARPRPLRADAVLNGAAAWLLGLLWLLPLFYAIWTAFHPAAFSAHFDPLAPLALENFATAWESAPFPPYVPNPVILVTVILAARNGGGGGQGC